MNKQEKADVIKAIANLVTSINKIEKDDKTHDKLMRLARAIASEVKEYE